MDHHDFRERDPPSAEVWCRCPASARRRLDLHNNMCGWCIDKFVYIYIYIQLYWFYKLVSIYIYIYIYIYNIYIHTYIYRYCTYMYKYCICGWCMHKIEILWADIHSFVSWGMTSSKHRILESPPWTCTYIHTYMHACIHTYIHTYLCTCVHMYINIYIYTHT